MNDEALREAVRGSFDDVRMRVPVSTLAARGDRLRGRRKMIAAGAGAAAAAAAVLIVTEAVPAAAPHSPTAATVRPSQRVTAPSSSRPSHATLAAWSVTRMHDGTLKVTIRELRDPAGLQTELRADGASVVVTDSLATPAGCEEWKGSDYRMGDVVRMANETGLPSPNGLEMYLSPSDIPSGAALWIAVDGNEVPGPTGFGYFTATPACLGS
jgi:hypothetical protein